ncbi:siderophore-interacting protein [Microbacterium sp. BK668]|uniref:siderophore-interacting protein n=1 Tax=Microbacterium sp. BK668 TaxID=2512118 RepID=UPI00105B89B4|nr:siderophore-interacting protein [Microbacterium sp. BK668]TDN93087.1 NADPH-dependent ferric siderophore reductase [Microbacterium sp. BK668]
MPSTSTAVRPAYRPYVADVARVERLSPHFVRVTFTADEFEHFGTARLDQRVKLVLPHADGTFSDIGQHEAAGDWYDRWRALPHGERNVFRTYTVRRVDPEGRELDVDFVTHHDAGPAGAWADAARAGQSLVVVGPDARSPYADTGFDWHPGTARRVLLAGDETAVPGIAGILESLGPAYDADVFIEVPTAADRLDLVHGPRVRVTWLAREDRPHGAALIEALTAWTRANTQLLKLAAAPRRQELDDIDVDLELLWDSPEDGDGEFYAWIAGEAATVKTLRRLLVSGHGVDRKRVAFMGYWRLGQAERIE